MTVTMTGIMVARDRQVIVAGSRTAPLDVWKRQRAREVDVLEDESGWSRVGEQGLAPGPCSRAKVDQIWEAGRSPTNKVVDLARKKGSVFGAGGRRAQVRDCFGLRGCFRYGWSLAGPRPVCL